MSTETIDPLEPYGCPSCRNEPCRCEPENPTLGGREEMAMEQDAKNDWHWKIGAPCWPWANHFLTLELLGEYEDSAPGIDIIPRICRLVGRELRHEGAIGRLA